jgi:hypothetical protein
MTDSPVETNAKREETNHGLRLRGAIVPVFTFVAGIGSALLTQSFIGHQQLLQAKRETRVAVLRDYTSACYRDAGSLSDIANLPLHLASLREQPGFSKKKEYQMYQMDAELRDRMHKTANDLAVQAEVVNALFQTKVDPVGVVMKDVPPEFNALPGEVDVQKMMDRLKQEQDPLATLAKYASLLGRQSKALSDYCQNSVQALSKEVD